MGRRRYHHLERTPRKSDLLKKNKTIKARSTPMQKNLDIIHPSIFNLKIPPIV
jgi:hypothetical protein